MNLLLLLDKNIMMEEMIAWSACKGCFFLSEAGPKKK